MKKNKKRSIKKIAALNFGEKKKTVKSEVFQVPFGRPSGVWRGSFRFQKSIGGHLAKSKKQKLIKINHFSISRRFFVVKFNFEV